MSILSPAKFISGLSVFLVSTAYLIGFCWIHYPGFQLGAGGKVFRHLIDVGSKSFRNTSLTYGSAIAISTCFILLLVYPSDILNWKVKRQNSDQSETNFWRGTLLTILFLLCIVSVSYLAYVFIFAPYLAYLALAIASLAALKTTMLKNIKNEEYFLGIVFGLIASNFVFLILWILSLSLGAGYSSNRSVKINYHEELSCDLKNATSFDLLRNVSTLPIPPCDEAYMVFISPFTFITGCFIVLGVTIFLYRAEIRQNESDAVVKIEPLAQLFVGLVIICVFGLWIASSISVVTRNVADNVLWISFSVLISLFVVWITVFGIQRMFDQLKHTSLGKKGVEFLTSDWGYGLLCFSSLPIIVVFLISDYIKQFIRRKTNLSNENEERNSHKLTKFTREKIEQFNFNNLEYGSIITKSLIWGIFYFTMSVGVTRITVVFLSALRGWLADLSLEGTSAALVGVGLLLFLLPPIPGVPVYITLGVVLPDKLVQLGFNFWWGILYAIVLSFALKLLALLVQQKIIGELWGSNSIWVREFVQINSTEIKATRQILSRPGWNFSKIVILTGGPDWPTSVLTGIMRLNVFQMMLGTVPVLILITPTVISGAMIVRQNENEIYSVLSTASIVVTVMVQSLALLLSFLVIADEAVKYEDDLRKTPPDEEVLQREKEKSEIRQRYAVRTSWKNLSNFWKVGHIISLISMIISCYAFLFLSRQLFEPFDVQNSIRNDLGGNALNLVKRPQGWVFLSTFLMSCIYLLVFNSVQSKENRKNTLFEHESLQEQYFK